MLEVWGHVLFGSKIQNMGGGGLGFSFQGLALPGCLD